MNNFKFALRSLLKTPGVSLIAVLTLAVGIGSCVAMFSLLNSLLLRPLVFKSPDKLIDDLLASGFERKKVTRPASLEDVFINLTGKDFRED